MGSFAILVTGESEAPHVVKLREGIGGLDLTRGDGTVEAVPWWRVYRIGNEGTLHRFRRLDRKSWELRVTSGADRALLAHVGKRPFHRLIHPLRRLQFIKVVIGAAILFFTVAQHAPAEWAARSFPQWAQHRS